MQSAVRSRCDRLRIVRRVSRLEQRNTVSREGPVREIRAADIELPKIAEEIARIDIVDVAIDVRVCCEWIGEPVGRGDASLTCIDLDVISPGNPRAIRTGRPVEKDNEKGRVPGRAGRSIAFAVVVTTRHNGSPL